MNTDICWEKKDDRYGKENKRNHQQRRPPSSQRKQEGRENITHQDGITRG
jgi:hypothetical protein